MDHIPLKYHYINPKLTQKLESNRQHLLKHKDPTTLTNLLISMNEELIDTREELQKKDVEKCLELLNKLENIKNELERLEKMECEVGGRIRKWKRVIVILVGVGVCVVGRRLV